MRGHRRGDPGRRPGLEPAGRRPRLRRRRLHARATRSPTIEPHQGPRRHARARAASLPVVARRTVAWGLTGFEWAVGRARLDRRRGAHERRRARRGHGRQPGEGPRGGSPGRRGWRRARVGPRPPLPRLVRSAPPRWSCGPSCRSRRATAPRARPRSGRDRAVASGQPARRPERRARCSPTRRATRPAAWSTRPGARACGSGSAEVSPKHANFIQADEGGSADDVRALMGEVRARVQAAHRRRPRARDLPGRVRLVTPRLRIPRIRARRIEVRRDEGRRRRVRLAIVVAVLALVGLAVAVVRSPVLDVDEVAGRGHRAHHARRGAAGGRHPAGLGDDRRRPRRGRPPDRGPPVGGRGHGAPQLALHRRGAGDRAAAGGAGPRSGRALERRSTAPAGCWPSSTRPMPASSAWPASRPVPPGSSVGRACTGWCWPPPCSARLGAAAGCDRGGERGSRARAARRHRRPLRLGGRARREALRPRRHPDQGPAGPADRHDRRPRAVQLQS